MSTSKEKKQKDEEQTLKTFKVRVYPTKEQREYIAKAFGIRRFVYNWACEQFYNSAEENKFPRFAALQKKFNNVVSPDPNFKWLKEVTSMVRQEAFKDFDGAIEAYAKYRYEAKRTPQLTDVEKHKPRFKKKGKCVESCRWSRKNDSVFKIDSNKHFSLTAGTGIPRLKLLTAESVLFLRKHKIILCTISYHAGEYYASLTYEIANPKQKKAKNATVGIDLGIKHPVATFDGTNTKVIDLPKGLAISERKREKLGRQLSRKEKDSKRFEKKKLQLQKAYVHENNIKREFREQITHWLASEFNLIKIDNFDFTSAINLKNVQRSLYRVGSYAFKMRLEEKVKEFGGEIFIIPKGTPTTQTCSNCGCLPSEKIGLDVRVYNCEHCGFTIDRDANAAINAFKFV